METKQFEVGHRYLVTSKLDQFNDYPTLKEVLVIETTPNYVAIENTGGYSLGGNSKEWYYKEQFIIKHDFGEWIKIVEIDARLAATHEKLPLLPL